MDQQPFLGSIVVELVQRVVDLSAGNANSQMISCYRLNGVSFIENHNVVIGQDAHSRAAKGKVAKQECVIDNQDLRILDTPSSFEIKALAISRTTPPQAIPTIAGNFVPHRPKRLVIKVAEGTIDGPL